MSTDLSQSLVTTPFTAACAGLVATAGILTPYAAMVAMFLGGFALITYARGQERTVALIAIALGALAAPFSVIFAVIVGLGFVYAAR